MIHMICVISEPYFDADIEFLKMLKLFKSCGHGLCIESQDGTQFCNCAQNSSRDASGVCVKSKKPSKITFNSDTHYSCGISSILRHKLHQIGESNYSLPQTMMCKYLIF